MLRECIEQGQDPTQILAWIPPKGWTPKVSPECGIPESGIPEKPAYPFRYKGRPIYGQAIHAAALLGAPIAAKSKAPGPKPEEPDSAAPFNKKLFWKQLDIPDAEGTLFGEEMQKSKSLPFPSLDTAALSRMFEVEKVRGTERTRRSLHMLSKAQQRNVGTKVLSDHRARNIAIVLKRLPVSTKDLAQILLRLRWEAKEISSDDLEQILEIIPTQEESDKLREHHAPEARSNLRDVEQLVFPLALIKRSAARVRLLLIARNARLQFSSTIRMLRGMRSASAAIQKSQMLKEVMVLALALGNYINHGDSTKGAKAITVGSLMALRDFKSGKMSTFHFLCASIHRADPSRDVAEVLAKELKPATALAKLQVSAVQTTLRTFARDLETITAECTHFISEYNEDNAGDEEEDGGEEQEEAMATAVATAAMAEGGESEAEVEDATRWVEDVMKIRGSPSRRLRCMRRVVQQLSKLLRVDVDSTSDQVSTVLRFCGIQPPARAVKEVPADFEALLQQLTEFVKVFKQHWDEVRSDLPSYQLLFGS